MTISKDRAENFVNEMVKAYKEKDLDFYHKIIPDLPLLFFGTAKHEDRRNVDEVIEQYRNDHNEVADSSISFTMEDFDSIGQVCWFGGYMNMSILSFDTTTWIDIEMRFTMVLQEINDKLMLRQFHLSVPHSGVEEGKSFPTTKGLSEQLEEWIREFDFNPNYSEELKKSKLKEYLANAKELLKEVN